MTPYIEKLSDLLSQYDFILCERHEVLNEVAYWKKPSALGSNVFEYIAVSLVSKPKANAMFTACFGLSSPLVTKLEKEAGLAECSEVVMQERRAIFGSVEMSIDEDFLSIPVNWLVANKGGGSSVIWRFFSESFINEIEYFEETFLKFVIPELRNFSNIQSFREYMFSLAERNRLKHAPGAVSPDTINYTSLICFFGGEVELALCILKNAIGGEEIPLNIQNKINGNDETYKNILLCRMKKTLNYLTHMHTTK